jgi:hypothetical protein
LTPAEEAHCGRVSAQHTLFDRLLHLTSDEVARMRLERDDAGSRRAAVELAAAELAAALGRSDEYIRAYQWGRDGVHDAHFLDGTPGDQERRVFSGAGYEPWARLASRAALHCASLAVADHLSPEQRELSAVPQLA